ncbi:YbaN family protein [Amaricoccus tamworthensis]|uniref:YbaN family protein n=1 Tax=Amaricoccus tamworthensis TaxID=57002 RepID=UPI003C7B7D12
MSALKKFGRSLARAPMRAFWFLVGLVSLALGTIGIALPVLPTTPFVILAAFAFSRSAPGFAAYLDNHRLFGPMIADWRSHGAIARRYKIIAVTMMAAAFALSVAMAVKPMVLLIQAVCLSGAAAFVLTRPDGPPGDD